MRREDFLWQLPPAIEVRLSESTYGRQRAIFEDGHLLVILHTPPSADTRDRKARVFLRSLDGKWHCDGQDNGEVKLKKLLRSYGELLQRYDDAYDRVRSAKHLHEILEHVMPLHRSASNLSAALQSAREFVREDAFLIAMRDEAYELARGFDLLLNDAKLQLDYRIAESAEEQSVKTQELAQAQHKLNVLAAITFPLMALGTIFGMSITTGLENQSPALFWVLVLLGGTAGFFAMMWVARR